MDKEHSKAKAGMLGLRLMVQQMLQSTDGRPLRFAGLADGHVSLSSCHPPLAALMAVRRFVGSHG